MPQRGEIIQRHPFRSLHVEVLGQFTKQLRLLDAVDPQLRFEVGVQLDDFLGIAGMFDDKVDQEGLQFVGRVLWRRGAVPRRRR